MKQEDWSLGRSIAACLRVIKASLSERFDKADIGITFLQFIILKVIASKEEVTLQKLATIMMQDKSGIMRKVDNLQKNKFVARIPNELDKRKKILVVTQLGAQKLEEGKALEQLTEVELMKNVSTSDKEKLLEVLSTIRVNGNHYLDFHC